MALISVLSYALLVSPATSGGYPLIRKIPVQRSRDYLAVDGAERRLSVSHGTQVEMLDIDSLKLVGAIPKTPGVHGIALAPEHARGFISYGQTSTVTIFDLKTLKQIAHVPTGSMIRPPRAYPRSTAEERAPPQLCAATHKVVGRPISVRP